MTRTKTDISSHYALDAIRVAGARVLSGPAGTRNARTLAPGSAR
jgi:hypothetical protein